MFGTVWVKLDYFAIAILGHGQCILLSCPYYPVFENDMVSRYVDMECLDISLIQYGTLRA